MKKRRVWLCLIVVFLLTAVVLLAFFEPNRILRGLLAGEPFYRERPLSHWKEVLRERGRAGSVPPGTAARFRDGNAAFPVLRECARDPDRNVRWPAIYLLDYSGLRTQPALDLLVEALEDSDIEVRLKATGALARWGPMARQAAPALTARLQDPEVQVADHADLALWAVDQPTAVAACGYRPFTSGEFGFSVMLPGEPEREDRPLQDSSSVAHSFQQWHHAGPNQAPTRYVVLVVEYPDALLKGLTEEDLFQRTKDSAPFFTGGKVVEEKKVSLGGRDGREYLLDVEGQGRLLSRQVWVGPKLYAVMVAYKPQFLNAQAAGYFLDSFRLDEKGDLPAKQRLEAPRASP
jgi:HEAT repeats